MEQITISKAAYDKMIVALTMIAIAADKAEDGTVPVDALDSALEAAGFPNM